jgi:membrane-bound lytic murein transglycosylase A
MIKLAFKGRILKHIIFLFTISLFIFTGCTTKLEHISKADLEEISFEEIDGFYDDDLTYALEVYKKDCKRAKRYELFKEVCQKAESATDAESFFTNNFQVYKLLDNEMNDKGTITGYYEPLLYGSLEKTDKYQYPIYKTPDDMIVVDLSSVYPKLKKYRLRGKIKGNKLIPYDARKEFESRDNKENLEVIAYVDNKVDLFLLQIQGSGKVKLESGPIINVGYSNQNGRRYKSIGKYMLKKGYINRNQASIQGMKKYFEANPQMVDEILNINESYVFFVENKKGATGSLGSELTAKRNLAVDRKYIPLGMPVFIDTKNPVTKEPIQKLMVAADTGGAIKGEIRADFFWGYGDNAFEYAGRMKEKGKLYIFVPKK